ncbi:MAG: hypothetical protein OXH83_14025 [Bryobacterales bacterium]|nr:hypothetical protein [Bryobacterales bacterium]
MRQVTESSTGQAAGGGVEFDGRMPEIESFAALSRDQVASIAQHGVAATEDTSVNWEFTRMTECCCSFTC